MLCQLLDGISPGCNADCPRTDGFPASNVGGCVAYDDESVSLYVSTEHLAGTPLRYSRQLRPVLVIGSERIYPEALDVDAGRSQLRLCTLFDIAGEKSHHH